MIPTYHPIQALLVDYAAGALEPGRRLVLASHLRVCEACRREASLAESIGGAALADAAPAPMAHDALALALARIERPTPPLSPVPSVPADWISVPADVAWAARRKRWVAPGVWVAPVTGGRRGPRSYLLRVGAGMSVPLHTHRGSEMVCVLKGAYTDGPRAFGPGDFSESDESVEHRPTITKDGECVSLVAADDSLIARDWVGLLFQPIVGI